MTRALAAALVLTLSLGASWPKRVCAWYSTCCQACHRSERGSLRPDCCRLIDAGQRAASNPAREVPAPTPDAAPTCAAAPLVPPQYFSVALFLAWAPRQQSTSPPTPLRI